jgi:hypothetical protein
MRAGELKLEFGFARGGQLRARLSDAAPAPERPFMPWRWQPRDAVDVAAALGAFEAHEGAVRLSLPVDDYDALSSTEPVRHARACRPDALWVVESTQGRATTPAPALPVRCASLEGQGGLRFDAFTEWAAERGVLTREVLGPDELRRFVPHVCHLSPDGAGDPTSLFGRTTRSSSAGPSAPSLVVLDWKADRAGDRELAFWVRRLAQAGCLAVLAVMGDAPSDFGEASRWLYRGIAHDRPLDEIARGLSDRGHRALVALNDAEAETGVSLRRAVFERRRSHGPSLEKALRLPSRAANSELEELLAERGGQAAGELKRLAHEVLALDFEQGEPALVELHDKSRRIDALLDAAGPAFGWLAGGPGGRVRGGIFEHFSSDQPVPKSHGLLPEGPPAMPARALRAFLHRAGAELRGGVRVGEPFGLAVSIDFVKRISELQLPGVNAPIALEALERAFGGAEAIDVDLTIWAPTEHFKVRCDAPRVSLPRMGESGVARFEIEASALPPGVEEAVRRLRVAAYHRNRLLQSLVVDVAVGRAHCPERAPAQAYDYAVSDELLTVDRDPVRRLSLFVNDGGDGSHWIGARVEGSSDAHLAPIALGGEDAKKIAARVHDKLRLASALDGGDRYAAPLAQIGAADRAEREQRLVELATEGHRLYLTLFAAAGERGLQELQTALGAPDGCVEVARCRGDAPALPWQVVYDLPLSPLQQPTLCPSYLGPLGRSGGPLERPSECARQPCCPHRPSLGPGGEPSADAPNPGRTVCPFGFWGARHKIAQPLAGRSNQATVPTRRPSGQRGVTVGYFSFENAAEHVGRIALAAEPRHASTQSVAVLSGYLKARNDALIYLYCHGKAVDDEFLLQLGADEAAGEYLGASDLMFPNGRAWPGWAHGPFVVLNGCKTLQVQPTSWHVLLGLLRQLGAAAVIGPEIEMFTTTAAKIGEAIVAGALERVPLDALMMHLRRGLLRELNPMGLAYNVYAPSGLVWSPPGEPGPGPEGGGVGPP